MINDGRSLYLDYSERLRNPEELGPFITSFFPVDALINHFHPFNQIKGAKGLRFTFVLQVQDSLHGLYRQDDIFMFGVFEGHKWISSTGYYVGQFTKDRVSIKALGNL